MVRKLVEDDPIWELCKNCNELVCWWWEVCPGCGEIVEREEDGKRKK